MRGQAAARVDLKTFSGNYRPISEAPDVADLWLKDPTGQAVRDEAEKRYLCSDSQGNVYLQMNPAVWPLKIINGMVFKIRPEPKPYEGGMSLPGAAATKPETMNFNF